MENKFKVENHGKTGNARCKTRNRDPTACMGVKACAGSDKVRKMITETKSMLKLVCSKL